MPPLPPQLTPLLPVLACGGVELQLTKLNQELKAKLEDGFKQNGQRTWVQVLCNSAGGSLLCLAARLSLPPTLPGELSSTAASPANTALLAGFLGHYACCCADTWASEVGILSSKPPRLVTTLKVVPPGTNGGVSALGLLASASGGLFMGVVFWLAGSTSQSDSMAWRAVLLGLASGLLGSLIDSLLGATVQYSGFCERTRRVVAAPRQGVKHVSGVALLGNHAVNAVSAAATALAAAAAASLLI
mmetsp:Transcript_2640/g.7467  ORF Transcript_2640/g.7467 Transcript_2640/m.7467 type:complete len:245 (+) Transcript_2640:432-1166(+)